MKANPSTIPNTVFKKGFAIAKPTIWLAGDSTLQAYEPHQHPQAGWGEALLRALCPEQAQISYHRSNCPFAQQRTYEAQSYKVDNCAMGARSSKTFQEEGRLQDILENLQAGDWLFIQFGHNDAASHKPERFVPVHAFGASLLPFLEGALSKAATPVLLSSIVVDPYGKADPEVRKIANALPAYAKEMQALAQKHGVPYVPMGQDTVMCCKANVSEGEQWYREDRVHLTTQGAAVFAAVAAKALWPILNKAERSLLHGNETEECIHVLPTGEA